MTPWNKRNDRRTAEAGPVAEFALSGSDVVCRTFDGERYLLAVDELTLEAATCIVRRHGQERQQAIVGRAA